MSALTGSTGIFAITKTRVLLTVALVITWIIAGLIPHSNIEASFKSRIEEARQKLPNLRVDWHSASSAEAARERFNTSKVALLIEPRPLPHLVPQLLHMISVVPPDWRFVFVGSNKSVISVGRSYAVKHQQVAGKLDLLELPPPWEIDSKEKIHRLMTDTRFYDEFLPGVEWILKYEYDSILCANSESSLNDWLVWDWAGAPRTPDDRFSGNGGLSLRRVSTIKRVLKFQERINDTAAEDEWFGGRLWTLPGAKVASGSTGQLAVEDVYIPNAMGFHVRDGGNNLAHDVWKKPEQRKAIFRYCPELSMIMDMKLEVERCENDDREGGLIDLDAPADEEEKKDKGEVGRGRKSRDE